MTDDLVERVIAAYGGRERWLAVSRLNAVVSAGGLAFRLKGRRHFDKAELSCAVDRPYCRLRPIDRDPMITGVLDGSATRLETDEGEILAERAHARSYFPYGRRFFRWDDLDMAYFTNYAFWNYLTLPRLLMSDDLRIVETGEGRLVVDFPETVPTHSSRQVFHVDPVSGRLLRHDYTADVVGGFAKASNLVVDHAVSGGLLYPSRRKVTPRGPTGKPLPGPILIDITIQDLTLE